MLAATAAAVTAERAWMLDGGRGVSPIEMLDADMECEHERLRGDPSPVCGCWVGEILPLPDATKTLAPPVAVPAPTKEIVVTAVPKKKKSPAPVVTSKDAGDLVDKLLHEIDAEIAELQAARERVAAIVG